MLTLQLLTICQAVQKTASRGKSMFVLSNSMFQISTSSHTRSAAIHVAAQAYYRWHAAAGQLQISNVEYGCAADTFDAPAWRPRLYSPLDSGRDYSVATDLGQ